MKHIAAPLGLLSIGFGPAGIPVPPPLGEPVTAENAKQPVGHIRADSVLTPLYPNWGAMPDNPVALGPAGRAHIDLDDLLTYLMAHASQSPALLPPKQWAVLHSPVGDGEFALGWAVSPSGLLLHSGSNTLNFAEVALDLKRGAVAAVVSNDASSQGTIDDTIASALQAAYAARALADNAAIAAGSN